MRWFVPGNVPGNVPGGKCCPNQNAVGMLAQNAGNASLSLCRKCKCVKVDRVISGEA